MKKIVIYRNSMKASGGVERVISNLANVWNEKYILYLIVKDSANSYYPLPESVNIVSLDMPLHYDMHNRFQRILSTLLSFVRSRNALREKINVIKPDYIYSTTPLNAMELFSLGNKYWEKMVISEHGSYYAYNSIYKIIKRVIYPKVYCVSVPNTMDTEIYKAWGCNAKYMPHIVTYKANEMNDLGTKTILNIGRLTSDKQQDLLIKMWSRISDHKGWKLVIVGDGENKNYLEELVVNLQLSDCVELLPATKRIESLYKQASIFAFASRGEGFGMVLLEAMSFGIPCISFDCPSGPRDIIHSGENGFLISQNDLVEYQYILEKMIGMDKNELEEYGRKAFDTVKNWDNDKIMAMWHEVYA